MNNNLAVIFDMDGVLVDSVDISRKAFDLLFSDYSLSMAIIEQAASRSFAGGALKDLLIAAEQHFGVHIDHDTFSAAAANHQYELLKDAQADQSLITFLEELTSNAVPIGVGTSSTRTRAETIIKILGLSNYFTEIVCAEDVPEHKPNPHIFLEVAQRLDTAPDHCIVIEDAISGLEAAKRAGMVCVGFNSYNQDKTVLKSADMLIENFTELNYKLLIDLV